MGPDGIPNEFYKEGGEVILGGLERLFGEIVRTERVLEEWNKTKVTLLHKGGHKSKKEIKNYRPVAVANTISNIFCGILKEKITEVVEREGIISDEQSGFRKNRRGTDNLYIMKEIIEEAKKEGKQYYCAFLDIEKAYDTVDREVLWEILHRMGLEDKVVNIVKSLYNNTSAEYSLGDIKVEEIRSRRGLRQGCTLSPLLFSLFMEEFTRRIKKLNLGIRIGEELLAILLFADDIILLAETPEDLQRLLREVDRFSRDVNIKFSAEKSKVMIVNERDGEGERRWQMEEEELEVVQEYKYLGTVVPP